MLPQYSIARFPVIHAQMDEFFEACPQFAAQRILPGKDALRSFPEETGWQVADAFCHWVGGRLPTADEWLAAAQGPLPRLYPWGDDWDAGRGNFTGYPDQPGYPESAIHVTWSRATPVDAYPSGASPFGVLDLAGNLSEWTCTPYPAPTDPAGRYYVVKGYSVWDARESSEPLWFGNLIACNHVASVNGPPMYIGFRPIRQEE
jgi:formylglycine-generating enzyme required for sulfatase activity